MALSIPRLPDPFRRVRVPSDLDSVETRAEEVPAAEVGLEQRVVERIWKMAKRFYRSRAHPALGLTIRRDGQVILDRTLGHARGNGPGESEDTPKVLATPDTPYVIFSAAKAMTATITHVLDERGNLHIGDRVVEYIPEFGKHGKESITIGHILSHRAGIPSIPSDALDLDRLDDRESLLEMMCEMKPSNRPGKLLAYHAVSGGFVIAEIIQRVTGKTIREVLAEEILDPLGFDLCNYGVPPERVEEVALSYPTGPPALPPISTLLKRALGVPADQVTEISNDPRFMTTTIPAANVICSPNELCRFYELLRAGGELDGIRVMEERTIRRALTEQSYRELDFSLGFPTRFSLGYMLGAEYLSLYGFDTELAFGHLGFTNILGWADPERAISVGLITSGKPTIAPQMLDFLAMGRTISSSIPKVESARIVVGAETQD